MLGLGLKFESSPGFQAVLSVPGEVHEIPQEMWEHLWSEVGWILKFPRKIKARNRLIGDPYGNRTRVSAVKGPRPNR